MTFSVIIPLYNKAPYVRRAIDSVLAQTLGDWELIIVNDGSTDGSEKLAAQYDDPRIRIIHQANAGPGAARNRGVAEATGQWAAFLDADDQWMEQYLQQALENIQRYDGEVAAISCGYELHPPGRSTRPMWEKRGLRQGLYRSVPTEPTKLLVTRLAYMSPCTTVARLDAIRRHQGFYGRDRCTYGEDSFLWLKVLLNHAVAVDLRPGVRVFADASNLSANRAGARPVEPILTHARQIIDQTPAELHELLRRLLRWRAMKTAAVLGYFGQWRRGRQLLTEFFPAGTPWWPRLLAAHLAASPLGTAAGRVCRWLR